MSISEFIAKWGSRRSCAMYFTRTHTLDICRQFLYLPWAISWSVFPWLLLCWHSLTTGKDFPVQLIPSATMDPGRFHLATVNDLTGHWWRDRRDVYALSTIHNKSVVTVMKQPKGSRTLPCPSTIADYSKYMGGVDLTDQHFIILCNDEISWWWTHVSFSYKFSRFSNWHAEEVQAKSS